MFSHRRTALFAFALGLAITWPACAALAQSWGTPSPDDTGSPGAVADAPAPSDPLADTLADATTATPPMQPTGRRPSGVAEQLADWVAETDDNGGLPFIIVDKLGARIFAFDQVGEFLGSAPALVGLARGDDSAPGIGDLKLSDISPTERTTPAGRFVAEFGDSNGHGTMLWVDLPDAISLHPVMSVSPGEHRLQRIKSSDPDQHRISYGCINVPKTFYDDVVLPALAGGNAVVYVLPDTKTIDQVFPAFAASVGGDREHESPGEQADSSAPNSRAPDPESSYHDAITEPAGSPDPTDP